MTKKVLTYKVTELPDPSYPKYRMAAQGDVRAAAGCDFKQLLQTLGNLEPGSTSVSLRYKFNPQKAKNDPQSRLSIYLMARTNCKNLSESLKLLIEDGPLNRFYNLEPTKYPKTYSNRLNAVCDIVRREDAVTPLHPPEFNDRIPPFYYSLKSFDPYDDNDYLSLDRVLESVEEEVLVDVCIEPADVSNELSSHTKYLSQLESINRSWDRHEDDDSDPEDYFEKDPAYHTSSRNKIKPLRYQDPLAEDIFRSQQRFHESFSKPNFLFHIRIFAETQATARLIASTVAGSAFKGGTYRIVLYGKEHKRFNEALKSVKEICVCPAPDHELFNRKRSNFYSGLKRLSDLSTMDELVGVFRFPVASSSSPKCIRKNTDPSIISKGNFIIVGTDAQVLGLSRGLELPGTCKHGFISGAPGFGKTTCSFNIATQLHRFGVPILVIETAKTEYRILKTLNNHSDNDIRDLANNIEIYTTGSENVSPFRLNPLQILPGISVDEHIDNIIPAFKASTPLAGPLLPLLREALEQVYQDHPDKDHPPIMADLVAATRIVLSEKGYSFATNSDIETALEVREGEFIRGAVGKIFQCKESFPKIAHLMKTPTIIELDRLSIDSKCLITLFLLIAIREYLKTVPNNRIFPRFVIFIEEAHNIVGRNEIGSSSSDDTDIKASVADFICLMLAELRALGVGILIIDQFPSKVAPVVINSTSTKICFRQVAQQDRVELGASALFGPMEIEEIARLKSGEAFFYTEGYHGPRKIQTENLHDRFDFSTEIVNENILSFIEVDPWFQESMEGRIILELTHIEEKMDQFNEERAKINEKLGRYLSRYYQFISATDGMIMSKQLGEVVNGIVNLKQKLMTSNKSFLRNTYNRYLPPEPMVGVKEQLIYEFRNVLVNRFELINTDVYNIVTRINNLISRHQSAVN